MKTRKSDKCPHGMDQVGICITPAMHQTIHTIQAARGRKLGRPPAQWAVINDMINFAARYVNTETGELPAAIEAPPRRIFPVRNFDNDDDLRHIMEEYPYMCWAARPNNECIHANAMLTQFTGVPLADFLSNGGMGWAGVIHEEDRKRVFRLCIAGFQSLVPFQYFYRLRKADGYLAWIEDWAEPFYRSNGHLAGYIGLMKVIGWERPANTIASILTP